MGLLDDLKANLNPILGVRDDIGAALAEVFIVTRTWPHDEIGDGDPVDVETRMLPSPEIKQYVDDHKIRQGGAVQQGDIKLQMVSKQTYPTVDLIDGSVGDQNVEKFFRVGGILYRVIMVESKYVTWNILLRRVSKQD